MKLITPAVLAFAALLGCSGAPGGGGSSTTTPPPPTDGWENQTNIEAIFESSCSGCHGATWSSCWTVQANADNVESAVSSGAMPRGTPLTTSDKATLLAWLGDGAPCSGTKPSEDAGVVFVGGGDTPTGATAAAAPGQ
jgi:hypothetical protein